MQVIKYEAVHPMHGLEDMQQRLGTNRRCYVFMHEAMEREPLVVVYAAFMNKIARTLKARIAVNRKYHAFISF